MPDIAPATELRISSMHLDLSLSKEDLIKHAVTRYRAKLQKQINKVERALGKCHNERRKLEKLRQQTLKEEVHKVLAPMIQANERVFGPLRSLLVHRPWFHNPLERPWFHNPLEISDEELTLVERNLKLGFTVEFTHTPNPDLKKSMWSQVKILNFRFSPTQIQALVDSIQELSDKLLENAREQARLVNTKEYHLSWNNRDRENLIKNYEITVSARLATVSLSKLTGDQAEDLRNLLLATPAIPDKEQVE